MNPTASTAGVETFSPCSKAEICEKVPILGTCLAGKFITFISYMYYFVKRAQIHVIEPGSKKVLGDERCGNGVKEIGEECDCGGTESCANDTCCFSNCTLKANAFCRYLYYIVGRLERLKFLSKRLQ